MGIPMVNALVITISIPRMVLSVGSSKVGCGNLEDRVGEPVMAVRAELPSHKR